MNNKASVVVVICAVIMLLFALLAFFLVSFKLAVLILLTELIALLGVIYIDIASKK